VRFIETLEPRRFLSTTVLAVNAGGGSFVDSTGQRWLGDRGFTGGARSASPINITGTEDLDLYTQQRIGKTFSFSAAVKDGTYELELRFADKDFLESGDRKMNVTAEDVRVITNMDLVTAAGPKTPYIRTFTVTVEDGRLSLGFEGVKSKASLAGIRLRAGKALAPAPTTWHTAPDDPINREEAQSFVANGKLYVAGGYVDTPEFHATTRVDAYDPVAQQWKRMADAPVKITHAGTVVDGDTVWFVGGFVGDFPPRPPGGGPDGTSAVYLYSISKNRWRTGPALPAARGAGGAALVGRTLYFFGGANKGRTADMRDVYQLDVDHASRGWSRIASMPNPRNHLGTVAVAGKIYLLGGQHLLETESVNQNEVHEFDPATKRWTVRQPMPRPFSHFSSATVVYQDRYIITVGGESPHDIGKPDVYAYDTRLDHWGPMTPLPGARRAGVAGIIGNALYQSTGYVRADGQTRTTFAIADLTDIFD
jgi:N-acetylneuraminic acid mutarotase